MLILLPTSPVRVTLMGQMLVQKETAIADEKLWCLVNVLSTFKQRNFNRTTPRSRNGTASIKRKTEND